MYIMFDGVNDLKASIRDEIKYVKKLKRNQRNSSVKKIQEWLNYHGHSVVIDSDFGRVTERAVSEFQNTVEITASGMVDKETFHKLISPILEVLTPIDHSPSSFAEAVVLYAKKHLAQHPIEIGGQNKGPWVRLYMSGHDGRPWAWCAGFVTFIMRQAAQNNGMPMPLKGSFSCDSLVAQAKDAGLFISGRKIDNMDTEALVQIQCASVFLVRRTSDDWTHTGFVTEFFNDGFGTIEGNTNDDGHREGYEVCERMRGYKKKDFIVFHN